MINFIQPQPSNHIAFHHSEAAKGNAQVAQKAIGILRDALSGDNEYERLLIRAAAGAGKSFVLKKLITDCLSHVMVDRVAVVAFTNRQLYPLAESLGKILGKDNVCLFVSKDRASEISDSARSVSSVAVTPSEIPESTKIVISTVHKLKAYSALKLANQLGEGANGSSSFDVLFVDEAWQVPHYLFDEIRKHAPLHVGVGDVGQLPPLEVGENPWRGDQGFNPYRAWPTTFEDNDETTWVEELPAVWRPTSSQLDLWRSFYPNWKELNSVAAPGDRWAKIGEMNAGSLSIWEQVLTGVPTILEVDGLEDPDAPDIDLPLMGVIESLVDELFNSGITLFQKQMDDSGQPTTDVISQTIGHVSPDPLVAILATRNQAVDDAISAVERISARHNLGPADLIASTVDSWQGQTNGVTVATHPLSGATSLDEFNSAFGRLAVACTRATHGLLMVTRPGLWELLSAAPAIQGTPLGEPGFRTLPRQTHQRILASFATGSIKL